MTSTAHFDLAASLYERSGGVRAADAEAHIGDTESLRQYVYVGFDTAVAP